MTSFASALVACIGVIAAGYGAGRLKIIDTKGAGPAAIGAFVGRFALPALLFRELATLRWKDIDGRLLASVAAAKALLFAGVLGCSTLLESRRAGDDRDFKRLVAASAARAIFCTQSNDFALGLPVIQALYGGDEGRRMVAMLYLLAPISLVLLNPIGFLLMGLYEPDEGRSGRKETVRRVLKRVATTPLVACTALGALYGLALGPDALPAFADGFLGILGAGFTPTALFFTGLSLVGRVTPETDLLVPLALSFGKCVALPVVIYAILDVAGADGLSKGFGFVVGTIPTAPSVLVYTNEYLRHDEALVAKTSVALVVCTVFSTPIIFAAGLAARSESMATAADAEVADAFLCVPSALLATWCLCSFAATWRDEGTDDDRFAILSVNALCHAVGASSAALCSVASGTAGAAVVEVARLASCGTAACGALLPANGPKRRGSALLTDDVAAKTWTSAQRFSAFAFAVLVPIAATAAVASHGGTARDRCGVAFGAPQDALTLIYMLACVGAALIGLRRARAATDRRYASNPDLVALAANADGIASPLRSDGGEVPTPPSPRLSTAIGHRLLLFVLLHAAVAFLAAAASASRLATRRMAAVDVLDLVERTASSLMGAFLFLIFGLAKDQILVRHISDAVARLREPRSPAPSPSGFTEQWF
jgi:predicted permease